MAWSQINWGKVELLVFLDADTSLFVPEYKVSENLWYLLRDGQYRLNDNKNFLIQTSHPEHLVFASLTNPEYIYQQELAQRKLFGYPPYKFLLKLFINNPNRAMVEQEVNQVKTMLINLTKTMSGIKLTGPIEATPYYFRGRYRQIILAKIKYDNYKRDTKFILSKLPKGWKVDPNPNSILSL